MSARVDLAGCFARRWLVVWWFSDALVDGVVVVRLRWLVVWWLFGCPRCSVVAADCTGGPSRLKGAR
jgi:hypothetical protein